MAKKICLVANYDWVIYNFRMPLVDFLIEQGLEVILVCPPGEYSDRFLEGGYQWEPWTLNRRSTAPWRELFSIQDLVGIYRRLKPDLVHHITIKPIFYGSLAAKRAGIPRVINNFTGLGYLFSDAKSAAFLRFLVLPILRAVLPNQRNHTVLLNENDLQQLIKFRLIDPSQTIIIPGDGVDLDRFSPSEENELRSDPLTVVMAARLLWDKGVAEYVEAARLVNDSDKSIRFILAGEPDPGNPSCVPDHVLEKWRQEGIVELLGHREDMPEVLRSASVAVLPSYHEGLPMFLLEAAASGLPLIASDIPGNRLIVKDQLNGILIPLKNSQALAQAINQVLNEKSNRIKMGCESRLLVEKNFSLDVVLEQFLILYHKIGML